VKAVWSGHDPPRACLAAAAPPGGRGRRRGQHESSGPSGGRAPRAAGRPGPGPSSPGPPPRDRAGVGRLALPASAAPDLPPGDRAVTAPPWPCWAPTRMTSGRGCAGQRTPGGQPRRTGPPDRPAREAAPGPALATMFARSHGLAGASPRGGVRIEDRPGPRRPAGRAAPVFARHGPGPISGPARVGGGRSGARPAVKPGPPVHAPSAGGGKRLRAAGTRHGDVVPCSARTISMRSPGPKFRYRHPFPGQMVQDVAMRCNCTAGR